VIATLGTALTEEHAALIKRYAPRVLLAFDADAAGVKAARKAEAIFKTAGMETRMLEMPEGEDPDSLLRGGKRAQFEEAVRSALKVTEFHLRRLVAQAELQNADEEARLDLFRREALPMIRGTQSVSERQRYIAIVAPLHPFYFTVNSRAAEEQIQQEVEGRSGAAPQYFSRNRENWRRTPPVALEAPVAPPRAALTAEKMIVRALIEGDPEVSEIIMSDIEAEDLVTADYWKLIQRLRGGGKPMDVLRDLEAEDSALYASVVRLSAEADGNLSTHKGDSMPLDAPIIRGCLAELRNRRVDLYEQELTKRANEGDLQSQIELTDLVRRRKVITRPTGK
jgi:DNA primase